MIADGNDSPSACETPYSDTSAPFGWTAPEGYTITGVCIKSGSKTDFPDGLAGCTTHSGVLNTNGTYGTRNEDCDGSPEEINCYTVAGFSGGESTSITVTKTNPDCQDISHIDVVKVRDQEPTPTNTPTEEPSPTPTGEPDPTPTATSTTTPTASPTPTVTSPPIVQMAEWCVNGVIVIAPANNPPVGAVVTADGNACVPVTLPTPTPVPPSIIPQAPFVPPSSGDGGLK